LFDTVEAEISKKAQKYAKEKIKDLLDDKENQYTQQVSTIVDSVFNAYALYKDYKEKERLLKAQALYAQAAADAAKSTTLYNEAVALSTKGGVTYASFEILQQLNEDVAKSSIAESEALERINKDLVVENVKESLHLISEINIEKKKCDDMGSLANLISSNFIIVDSSLAVKFDPIDLSDAGGDII